MQVLITFKMCIFGIWQLGVCYMRLMPIETQDIQASKNPASRWLNLLYSYVIFSIFYWTSSDCQISSNAKAAAPMILMRHLPGWLFTNSDVSCFINFYSVLMCCSMADGQWSPDHYCLTRWLCCLHSDVCRFVACISAIKFEKTTFLFLFSGCGHVLGRYTTPSAVHYVFSKIMGHT